MDGSAGRRYHRAVLSPATAAITDAMEHIPHLEPYTLDGEPFMDTDHDT